MSNNQKLLVQFMAQLYKVGIIIEQFDINDKIIIKLSIPNTSYVYTDDIELSKRALIVEVNESLQKLLASAKYPLQILYRIRDEYFSKQAGQDAYLSVIDDFTKSNFFKAFKAMKNE